MTQSSMKTHPLARVIVLCFLAMSIAFTVSSGSPWAAERMTPPRIGIVPSLSDLTNIHQLGSFAKAGEAFELDRFIDSSSNVTQPTAVDVFDKNQRLLMNQSPLAILATYHQGPSFTGTVPVGAPVHIVYGISAPTGNPNPISLTITKPANFTPTLIRCFYFSGVTGAGNPITPPPTNLPPFSIGALSGSADLVIVVIDGFSTQAGPVFAKFDATRDAITETSSLTMNVDVLPFDLDLSVKKVVQPKNGSTWGSTATVPFGGKVTYKVTIKNESLPDPGHSTDIYLGPLLTLRDTLNTSGNDVNLSITASNFSCTPVSLCPTMPTSPISTIMGSNSTQALVAFTYPSSSNGLLPAQSSFDITFDVDISTSAQCSPNQNNKLLNAASFTYSNGTNTVSDQNPSNNSTSLLSPTTVSLTGLPPTGCTTNTIPGIDVKKTLLSPSTSAWGVPFTYEITITNTSGAPLSGLLVHDWVGGSGTPPFTATFSPTASNFQCSPACGSIPPSSSSLVVPFNRYVFLNFALAPLAANAVQTIRYDVQYDTPCASSAVGGSITNNVSLGGPANGSAAVTTQMPPLPLCELATTKVQTSGPTSFAGFPTTLGYQVQFKNTSNQTIRVGTLIDAIALDSSKYGDVPIEYSFTCTPTAVTLPLGTILSAPAGTPATIEYNNPVWAGVKLIDLSSQFGVVFLPGGNITCDISVTLKQPPTNDSLCQGAGTPNIVNSAFMDLAYGFNTNQAQPVYYQSVTTPLPKCVSVIVGKTAPNVFAGGAVTFTLTVKNVGSDPVSNITLNDNVPSDFTNVTWTCASGCSSTGNSIPSNSISIPLSPIAAGATVTVLVTATAPTILGSYCNPANVTFNPFPPNTFFEGDQNALTTASACVQVQSPTPTRPTLTKRFDPIQIGPNGTSTLTFNITNSSGDPKQTGISFSDTLPAGLQIVSVLTNGCSGTPTISSDGRTITLTGGQLVGPNADGSGKHSCQIAVKVQATGVCGVYKNNKENFSNVTNLDVSGVNQQLEVTGCTESCPVKTNEISCKADGAGGYLYTFTVTNNTAHVVTDVLLTPAPGSGITLNPKQPKLPAGGMAVGASLTFQVTITGGQPRQQACFDVTLMTTDGECCTTRVCPVLPECCAIAKDENIKCNRDGTYTYTLSVVNTGVNPIEHIYLYPPDGVTMTPNYFPVSLKPGDTFTTRLIIKGGKPGDKLCFGISLHSADMESCCKGEHCIVLPDCKVDIAR